MKQKKEDCEDISNENKQKLQNVIEISSESTIETGKYVDFQETISEDKIGTGFYTDK